MKNTIRQSTAGFTLVELIIGMSLALVITSGVMSTYLFLGRNLARLSYQQKLEAEGRRAIQYFAQDVRIARAVTTATTTAGAARVTFSVKTVNGEKSLTYYFNGTSLPVSVALPGATVSVPANSLIRLDGATGINTALLSNMLDLDFNYFDSDGDSVTNLTYGLNSIKKVSMSFTTQTGESNNGTKTPIYYGVSPRLLLRNRALAY